jgi:hypothetical protein
MDKVIVRFCALRVLIGELILSRDNVGEAKHGGKVGRRANGSTLSKFDAAYDSDVAVSRRGAGKSCFLGG